MKLSDVRTALHLQPISANRAGTQVVLRPPRSGNGRIVMDHIKGDMGVWVSNIGNTTSLDTRLTIEGLKGAPPVLCFAHTDDWYSHLEAIQWVRPDADCRFIYTAAGTGTDRILTPLSMNERSDALRDCVDKRFVILDWPEDIEERPLLPLTTESDSVHEKDFGTVIGLHSENGIYLDQPVVHYGIAIHGRFAVNKASFTPLKAVSAEPLLVSIHFEDLFNPRSSVNIYYRPAGGLVAVGLIRPDHGSCGGSAYFRNVPLGRLSFEVMLAREIPDGDGASRFHAPRVKAQFEPDPKGEPDETAFDFDRIAVQTGFPEHAMLRLKERIRENTARARKSQEDRARRAEAPPPPPSVSL